MDTGKASLTDVLSQHMRFLSARQAVLAQNVANLDTPGFKAKDVQKPDFGAMLGKSGPQNVTLRQTSPMHIGPRGQGDFRTTLDRNTSETSPTQNNVVMEDQMAKVSETGVQFQLTSTMLRKYTQLYRNALGSGNQ